MYLVQKNHLRGLSKREYKLLHQLTHLPKTLYNYTLYTVRQYFFAKGVFLPYEQAYHHVKVNEHYRRLPSQVAQQTMKVVTPAMRPFFGLQRARKKGKYPHPIRLPHYLPKDGFFVCTFPKDMFKVEGEMLRLSLGRYFANECGVRYLHFKVPSHVVGKLIKEIRLLPRYQGCYFKIEYVYTVGPEAPELDPTKYLGIDLGLNNFATCVSTDGTALILEGKGIKSYNRWWNKQKAILQSVYDKQGVKFGRKMAWLLHKRKHVINNFMAQAVHWILQECLTHQIGTVVIGELKTIKQHINLGKKTNQNFQYIPFGGFKKKLRAKCEYYGIMVLEIEEVYTSQTCSACGVREKKNRKYRGLYACRTCGIVRNTDVNGAINILQVASESIKIGGSGRVNRPGRIRIPTVVGQHPSPEASPGRAG
ncbi:MAG: RNA-guided endonuclease InsQ/TnpB family protein [Candidatus Heimdallarchaeota archaeon]